MSVTRVELVHLSWSPFRTNPDCTRFTRIEILELEQSHMLPSRDLKRGRE